MAVTERKATTLETIIDVVSEGTSHSRIWISRNYSQSDLIRDLKALNKKTKGENHGTRNY